MKFVMTQAVCPEGMQLLDGIADVYVADNQDPNNYLDEMRDAAALIVRIAKCDANAIENSPKLKVIGRTGVGYDSVDVKKATELTPICIAIALSLGISPIPWVIVIGACSNLAIATSFGTAVNMQILPAGYKFSDFVKIGGPLLIILIAVVSICSVAFLF